MPERWVETTLGQVAEFHNGYPFKPSELTGRGRPVVRIKQLLDADAPVDLSDVVVGIRQQIDNGDLVFSWSGTLASRIWDRGPALLNQHLFQVVERPGVLRGWLCLALDHAVTGLMEKAHGTTMKHVTKKVLEAHPVLLPPMVEQRRIVDLIDALDAQIEMLGQERTAANAMLVVGCRTLASPSTCESIVTLAEECDILDTLRVPVNETERTQRPGTVPYYGANGQVGFIDEAVFDEPLTLVPEDQHAGFFSLFRLKRMAYPIEGPAWVNNHAHVLRARTTSRDWVYYSLRHRDLLEFVTDATRSKLTRKNLERISLGIPNDWQQRAGRLRGIEDTCSTLTAERENLHAVRQGLLERLLERVIEIPESYDVAVAEAV